MSERVEKLKAALQEGEEKVEALRAAVRVAEQGARQWKERALKAEREVDRWRQEAEDYAEQALAALSNVMPTPERGYAADGGPGLMGQDLRKLRDLLRSTEVRLEQAKAETQRWATRMRELEERARHAQDVLRGDFNPPEIDEIRRTRGLEPLHWTVKP